MAYYRNKYTGLKESFLENNKDIYSRDEFDELCILIKSSTKDSAISILKKLIVKLKQRKNRANKIPLTTNR